MDGFLIQVLNGLDKGSAYALIALGLTLIFGTLGELICERAGVLNLGIEGIMTMGAMADWLSFPGVMLGFALLALLATVSLYLTGRRERDKAAWTT